MSDSFQFLFFSVLIGVGATAFMDLWALLRLRFFGVPSLDWALVGRWLGSIPRGRFAHAGIATATAVRGERALGWCAHYATGVVFAALLLSICGLDWVRQPTPLPALAFGLATVAAPFFIMQPALGAGVAASRTPNPRRARINSLLTHGVFGMGLYLSALLLQKLI
ncbi:Protein of unknown function [Microbulbifer donghaiensis]|uniref:DUF2938 domain-containing protein n=1 Tax=Microbulbifer donghaiensis TaxID=494016 RepID=A0A1M5ATH8_9GAMM|nr:DUF2938 domain-containing protein [Microbulbifer donghaiensis]SHF33539.1 Protein of unknown function [Microbulbifer donghaiensis]